MRAALSLHLGSHPNRAFVYITFKIFLNLSRSNSSLLAGLDFVAVAQAAASVCLESGVVALTNESC